MGMSAGGGGDDAKPNINVTPLIDVLLVLLIIFMVISPLKPSRFEAKVPAEPKPEDQQAPAKPNPLTLVVTIDKGTLGIKLNNEEMGNVTDTTPLVTKLTEVFERRKNEGVLRVGTNEVEKTLFIKAPRSIKYGDVVKVIDAVKVAGAQPIGLQIDDLGE
jgi:biopolymer transport protein ExbD